MQSAIEPSEATRSVGPHLIRCENPADKSLLGELPVASEADVRRIVERARKAAKEFALTPFELRRELLGAILEHVLGHADDLVLEIVRDAGKTRENAMLGEIWPVCEKLRHTIANGEAYLLPERVPSGIFPHKRAEVIFQPLGVIGIIAPWNYPLQNILGPTIPALFAGNAVVIKASEQVAWSTQRFQRIFDEALDRVGLSRDLVQIVNGFADTGRALISSGVDKIIFTGSMENGRKVILESAKNLTPVILELGGKDAFIVCEDAHLEQAAHAAMAGVFINAGQNCLAAERLIVVGDIYEPFVARVTELASALRQGPPLGDDRVDVGAISSPHQLKVVTALVEDALARGARAVVGGKRAARPGDFFEPTVLVDVPPDARILHEETFGPIMVILRAADDDAAIALANGSEYALSATVMTQDQARARKFAERLRAGGTSINDFGLTYMTMDLPFGGVGGSGYGRLNGKEGLRACCNSKAVLYDRLPMNAPAKLYPVGPMDYDVARETIRTLYTKGASRTGEAAKNLARYAWSAYRNRG